MTKIFSNIFTCFFASIILLPAHSYSAQHGGGQDFLDEFPRVIKQEKVKKIVRKDLYPTYIDLTAKPGSQRNIGELNLLAPFSQSSNELNLFNLRGQVDSNDSSEINIGLGKRKLFQEEGSDDGFVLGYYG